MYKKIGKKIKDLAKAIFLVEAIFIALGVIGSTVALIIMGLSGSVFLFDYFAIEEIGVFEIVVIVLVLIAIVLLAVAIFAIAAYFAYMSTWLLYAFGELVDKICDIEENTRVKAIPVSQPQPSVSFEEVVEETPPSEETPINE